MALSTAASASFKDLCIDAVDVASMARFWSQVIGLSVAEGGDGRLTGSTPQQTVWINAVAEPHWAKNRVHLDIRGPSVAWAEDLGARTLVPLPGWTVMTDPEGGEFCLFQRDQPSAYRLFEVVVDCADARDLAGWWAGVFGARLVHEDDQPWWWVDQIDRSPFDSLVFVPVPEPKTVKNRVHWDVDVDRLDDLIDAGATVLRAQDDEIAWNVMADPAGNEFCAFVSGT